MLLLKGAWQRWGWEVVASNSPDVLPVRGFAPATFWSRAFLTSGVRSYLSWHRGQKGDESNWVSQDLGCRTAPACHHVCANMPGRVNLAEIARYRAERSTCKDTSQVCHGDNSSSLYAPAINFPGTHVLLTSNHVVWGAPSGYALLLRFTQVTRAAALTWAAKKHTFAWGRRVC